MRTLFAPLVAAILIVAVGCDPVVETNAELQNNSDDQESMDGDSTGADSKGIDSPGAGEGAVDASADNSGGGQLDGSGLSNSAPTTQVRLSTCVALGQTLPNGTCMTFSAEYRFTGSGPRPDATYFWVIKPSRGADAVAQRVDMGNRQGTLQGVAESLRPDNGPFECHIVEEVDGTRTKVSRDFPLR